MISRTYSDGTPTVNYAYDSPGVLNSKGRLTQVSSSVSSYSYDEYDAEGKVMRSTQMTDGQAYLMDYAYNLAGAMTRETYPSGRVVMTSYDNAGRVSGVTGQKPGEAVKTYTSNYTYTAHGAVASMKFGTTVSRFEHTFFNSRLQPTEIGLGTTTTSTSLLKLMFTYGTNNNNGNILTQAITANGLTFNQSYTYDQVNRLLVAQENGGANWKQTFSYDLFGNRRFDQANTTANVLGPNPTISAANNRINATSYGYDNAGNMNVEPGKTYAFDGENRIKNYNSGAATYHYDGDGRRVKKVVGAVTTLMVYNASGQLIAEYNSPDQPTSGGTRYLTTDHLGSTRVVMDAAGVVVARHDYLPFGEEIASSIGNRSAAGGYGVDDGIRQKFTSKERDSESGLDYFLARYYSSGLGRFTSPDEFTGGPVDVLVLGSGNPEKQALPYAEITNPQSLNKYTYTYNNPLRYIDPNGHEPNDDHSDEGIVSGALSFLKGVGQGAVNVVVGTVKTGGRLVKDAFTGNATDALELVGDQLKSVAKTLKADLDIIAHPKEAAGAISRAVKEGGTDNALNILGQATGEVLTTIAAVKGGKSIGKVAAETKVVKLQGAREVIGQRMVVNTSSGRAFQLHKPHHGKGIHLQEMKVVPHPTKPKAFRITERNVKSTTIIPMRDHPFINP